MNGELGGAMNSLLDEAGRDLAGASIDRANIVPILPMHQAAELAHMLSQEAAAEDVPVDVQQTEEISLVKPE